MMFCSPGIALVQRLPIKLAFLLWGVSLVVILVQLLLARVHPAPGGCFSSCLQGEALRCHLLMLCPSKAAVCLYFPHFPQFLL